MLRGQDRYALFRLFSGKLGNEPAYSEIAALIRCDSQTAWSPEIAFLWPPIWPGAMLPVFPRPYRSGEGRLARCDGG
jgi:hypothetical protein